MKELELNDDQLKAAKAVYKAIRKAGKLGVKFWDDYGTLTAFNSRKITLPTPDPKNEYMLRENDVSYWEILENNYFNPGNADDELYFSRC